MRDSPILIGTVTAAMPILTGSLDSATIIMYGNAQNVATKTVFLLIQFMSQKMNSANIKNEEVTQYANVPVLRRSI